MPRLTTLVLGLVVGLLAGLTAAPAAVAAPAMVAGTVRDATGAPVPDAEVRFYPETVTNTDTEPAVQQVRADSSGHWEVPVTAEGLPGGRYKVRAVDGTGRAGWYPAQRTPDTATVIVAVADTDTRGLDITVLGAPTIGGQVTGSGGSPVVGALVTLYPAGFVTGGDLLAHSAAATTDQQGRWQLLSADIVPGNYVIRAGPPTTTPAGWVARPPSRPRLSRSPPTPTATPWISDLGGWPPWPATYGPMGAAFPDCRCPPGRCSRWDPRSRPIAWRPAAPMRGAMRCPYPPGSMCCR